MKTKKCSGCQETKPVTEFGERRDRPDGKQSHCKECGRRYHLAYYARNKAAYYAKSKVSREAIRERNRARILTLLKEESCKDCGTKNIVVLEFDHVRGKKEGNVSTMLSQGVAWERIEAEIKKCDVRCANCHRIRTAKVLGSFRLDP